MTRSSRPLDRKPPQKHLIQQGEDGGVGADAQGQGQRRKKRKRRALDEKPQSVLDVLP
jgi:hypothetical protein